jgi:hypothetical protein
MLLLYWHDTILYAHTWKSIVINERHLKSCAMLCQSSTFDHVDKSCLVLMLLFDVLQLNVSSNISRVSFSVFERRRRSMGLLLVCHKLVEGYRRK